MSTSTLDSETERLLSEGKTAARNGDKATARNLLTQVVERDPHNEQAWMWLSGVVVEPEEQQICLENVIVINPQNSKARKGLEYLRATRNLRPTVPATAALPSGQSEWTSPLGGSEPAASSSDANEQTAATTPAAEADVAPSGTLPWLQTSEFAAPVPAPATETFPQDPTPSVFDLTSSPGLDSIPSWVQPQAEGGNTDLGVWSNGPTAWSQVEGQPAPPTAQFDVSPFTTGPSASGFTSYTSGQLEAQSDAPNMGGSKDLEFPEWAMEHFAPDFAAGADASDALETRSRVADAQPHDAGAPVPEPFNPFGVGGAAQGPMGPSDDNQLPSPSELPGYDASQSNHNQGQPWYLQPAHGPTGSLSTIGMPSGQGAGQADGQKHRADKAPVANILCPHCNEEVPETALACPNCRYSFFVNCPNCHELVDTSDAKPGVKEPCPHCKFEFELMALGAEGTEGAVPYRSERLDGRAAYPAMRHQSAEAVAGRGMSFGWLLDILWLIVVILTVWALTQLPTWLHLTGQY